MTGIWATCSNVGNIIGLQTASVLLNNQGNRWENLMFYIFGIYLVIALAVFLCFVGDPKEVGLQLKDDHIEANNGANTQEESDENELE